MSKLIDNTIILLSLGALGYGLYMIFAPTPIVEVKEAPSGTVDRFQHLLMSEHYHLLKQ